MDGNPSNVIHNMAQNYRVFLADFPSDLKPEHLDVPNGEQVSTFEGLLTLHTVIGIIYEYFSLLVPDDKHWEDREYCYQAIEGSVKLLWAMSAFGQLIQGSDGLELRLSREVLDPALKKCKCKDPVKAFGVLEAVGFKLAYSGVDGFPSSGGYKKCATIALRYPGQNDPLLRAMAYYSARLPEKKSGRKEKGIIFEVFLRADFRPLLPGYTFHMPHLPATEEEVTRTLSPKILEVWNELTKFMTDHYPQYQLYFRVPFPRGRRWAADYSNKDNDYGLWSIFTYEEGLTVRIVLIEGTVNNMLEHVGELSPHFQESYLNAVACKDCSHCGKHVFYTHKDHVHRLCKSPWFISPYLHLEDLPDIERLIDFRLTDTH
jgi:hypothetical protein